MTDNTDLVEYDPHNDPTMTAPELVYASLIEKGYSAAIASAVIADMNDPLKPLAPYTDRLIDAVKIQDDPRIVGRRIFTGSLES